jgi:hypothetical protein
MKYYFLSLYIIFFSKKMCKEKKLQNNRDKNKKNSINRQSIE